MRGPTETPIILNKSAKTVRNFTLVLVLLFFFVSVYLLSQKSTVGNSVPTSDYDATVALAWFDLQLTLVEETQGFSPPVASRAFGYSGVALYEAVVYGMPDYQTLAGQLNELSELPQPASDEEYHWPTVANSALTRISKSLFPTASSKNIVAIDDLNQQFSSEFKSKLDADVFNRSVLQGQLIADAVYVWSINDGGHEAYLNPYPSDYNPPVDQWCWVPTPRPEGEPLPALHPYWGENRPFVLASGNECQPNPPPTYSEDPESDFYKEAVEVYDAVNNLTPMQVDIALFWGDDPGETATPPGHAVSILNQVLKEGNYRLNVAAEAYAKLGIALADAFIDCWYTKFEFNLVRPITYIRNLIDPEWNTLVTTPPFPEYTSGHSVQIGAAMQVLTDIFGDNYAFTDHTHDDHGMAPRSFNSFFEAADEAAISRLYGGIHYRSSVEYGLEQGKSVGKLVCMIDFKR